jgi:hypothetical protein
MCFNNVSRNHIVSFFFFLVMMYNVIVDHIFLELYIHIVFFENALFFLCLFSFQNKVFEKQSFSLFFLSSPTDRLTPSRRMCQRTKNNRKINVLELYTNTPH